MDWLGPLISGGFGLFGKAVDAISDAVNDEEPEEPKVAPVQSPRRNYVDIGSLAPPPPSQVQAPQPIQLAALERALGRR